MLYVSMAHWIYLEFILKVATVMQIEKALINDRFPTFDNFVAIYSWNLPFS